MPDANLTLVAIGHVESPLTERALAPKQGGEGAPEARLVFHLWVREALADVKAGDHVIVLTWLDRADRRTLRVHPRGDAARPMQGVFSTRSPDRPNPIGLHRVQVVSVLDELRLVVRGLEALDGTPILDVKPAGAPDDPRLVSVVRARSIGARDATCHEVDAPAAVGHRMSNIGLAASTSPSVAFAGILTLEPVADARRVEDSPSVADPLREFGASSG